MGVGCEWKIGRGKMERKERGWGAVDGWEREEKRRRERRERSKKRKKNIIKKSGIS